MDDRVVDLWHFLGSLDVDQVKMILFSGRPFHGYIVIDLAVKLCVFMHMLMTLFQVYLLFNVTVGKRFLLLNLVCIIPQQCALYCYYQHTKLNS